MKFGSFLKLPKKRFTDVEEARLALLASGANTGSKVTDKLVNKMAQAVELDKGRVMVNGVPVSKLRQMLKAGNLANFMKHADPAFVRYGAVASRYEELLKSLKTPFPRLEKSLDRFQRNQKTARRLGITVSDVKSALQHGPEGIEHLAKSNPSFAKALVNLKSHLSLKGTLKVTALGGVIYVGFNIYKYLYNYALVNSGCFKRYRDSNGLEKICKIRKLSCSSRNLQNEKNKLQVNYCSGENAVKVPDGVDPCIGWEKTDDACNANCNSEHIQRMQKPESSSDDEDDDKDSDEDSDDDDDDDDDEYFCRDMSFLDAFSEVGKKTIESIVSFFSIKSMLLAIAGSCILATVAYVILSRFVTSEIIKLLAAAGAGVLSFFVIRVFY